MCFSSCSECLNADSLRARCATCGAIHGTYGTHGAHGMEYASLQFASRQGIRLLARGRVSVTGGYKLPAWTSVECFRRSKPPGEHQNRWYMGVHPPQSGGIGYDYVMTHGHVAFRRTRQRPVRCLPGRQSHPDAAQLSWTRLAKHMPSAS